ncbi:hypothetical protein ACWD7T_10905 [Streptomyces sp. 900116325]
MPEQTDRLDDIEARDRQILRASSSDSDDWDDETWAAWFRTAERVHGDGVERTPLFDKVGAQQTRIAELEGELAQLSSRSHRVARTHQLFIEDHSDPGSEALGAQYELIEALSRSSRHEDLPLNPVETALRSVLAYLEHFDYDVTPREIGRVIAEALPRDDMSDRRRRLYIDGKGDGWIDAGRDEDGTKWIGCVAQSGGQWTPEHVLAETGELREIGRCW